MKITVEMGIKEFEEFLEWKKDRAVYERQLHTARRKKNVLAEKVLMAVELDSEEKHYVVYDQDHMDELAEMAMEALEE